MINTQYPSKLLQHAVEVLSDRPGIGQRTALRLALHILRQDEDRVKDFGQAIIDLKTKVKYCKKCHNISDEDLCSICADTTRDHSTICVVQNVQDVMAIENTQQYRGIYHVLGGIISPIDGIGPADLEIQSLIDRVSTEQVSEVILALSPTTEGETTNFFITRKLSPYDVKISTIARGVSIGEELEYTDEITLGRAIVNRVETPRN